MKQPTNKAKKTINALQKLLLTEEGSVRSALLPHQIETCLELLQSLVYGPENSTRLIPDNQFAIVPFLLAFTLAPQTIIAEAAASIVEGQLKIISSLHLLQLQDRLRGGTWKATAHLSKWNAMKFAHQTHFAQTNPHLLALTSFHHSGYVREAAVKYLNAQQSGVEVPYLLIRLTDWVPQVSEQAKLALELRLHKDYLHHFIENLLLIELLSKKKRGSEPEAIASIVFAKIHQALKAPENRPLLLKGLTAPKWETRRMCLKLLKIVRSQSLALTDNGESNREKTRSDAREVIEAVLAEKDVTNRLLIFDFAHDLEIKEQIDLMLRLGKDTAPSIRRNALEILCQIDSQSKAKNLERGLLDRSPLVREFARFKLIQTGLSLNFRQFYLDTLQTKPSSKIISSCLAGLGEVGDEKDAEILVKFCAHPQVGVRRFATLALGKLCPQGHDDIFLRMLNQPSVGLSRAATSVISGLPEPVNGAVLYLIFERTDWKHVKLNALRLFNSLPKWERLSYLLIGTASKQPEVKKMAVTYVEAWEQRYRTTFQFSLPNLEQQKNFRKALAEASNDFTPQVQATLKACQELCDR